MPCTDLMRVLPVTHVPDEDALMGHYVPISILPFRNAAHNWFLLTLSHWAVASESNNTKKKLGQFRLI